MSGAYADLIPGTSPSRRRSAYDDLLPGGTPAATVQPAEDARYSGDEAATELGSAAQRINEDMIASQPARMTMTRRGGVQLAPADLAVKEPPEVNADWSEVAKSILPGAGAQIRSAVANLRRMANEENIQNRAMVLDTTPVGGPELPHLVRRALERQKAKLEEETAARPAIEQDAAAAMQDMAAGTPKDMTTLQKAVYSAGTSAPTTLAGMAAGIVTRNPALAMTIAGGGGSTVQAGSTYGEARDKGASHDLASQAATIDGLIEGLDALPVGVALKPGSSFLKRLGHTAVTESLTEGGQQLLQDLRSMAMEDPEKTLGEVWENVKVAGLAGMIGGTVHGSIGAAANLGKETPAPMHGEAAPAAQPPVESAPPVEQPKAAESKPAAPTAYDDLVPPAAEVPAAATTASNEPDPWATPAEEPAPLTVEHPDVRSTLEQMVHEAGWFEEGGKAMGGSETAQVYVGGKAVGPSGRTQSEMNEAGEGRTHWIGKAEWAQELGMSKAEIAQAVKNALDGKRLGKRQKMAIDYMVEIANERIAYRKAMGEREWSDVAKDIKAEGVEPSHEDVADTDLIARASEIDEAAVEAAAKTYENDDAAFMEAVRKIINDHETENPDAGAARSGQENLGAPAQEEAAPGLQLESYTPAELEQRARAAKEAEARRIAEEQAAEAKRVADAQAKDFTLTGSDRTADVNPQQATLRFHGMPAGTATVPVAAAAGATPPARVGAKSANQQARPDAIRAAMQQLFGAPINEKGVSKKYLGIYKIKPQTIRLQNRTDLRTAAHEVGHHISNLNRGFRKVMRKHQQELVSIAPRAYIQQALAKHGTMQAALAQGDVRRLLIEEGFAEFIAEYLTNPATLRARVPGFYAAFESWLAANPKYAASLDQVAGMVGAHQALGAAETILAKVGVFKPTVRERAAALVSKDSWDTFAQATLDKWHPLKLMVADLAPAIRTSKNPYVLMRVLAGDTSMIEDWVSNWAAPFDYTKRLDPKNYGKPLKQILEPILKGGEQEINAFKAYLIARRAAELMKVGKERLLTKEEIQRGLGLESGQRAGLFAEVAKEIYAYNDRLLDYAVEGGLLSPEVAAKFREYANYIPFFREPDGEAKGDGSGNPFKRLTGGTQNLRDPIENLLQNTANIIHATNRNAALRSAVKLAESVPGGGRWLETVKVPMQVHELSTDRIIEQLEKQGVVVDRAMAQGMAAMQTFFTPSGKGDDRARVIVYKDGGELKAAQVNDPLLWKTLGNMPPLEMDLITKALAFPARTLRAGVVLDPTFMVRNFVRDTLSATIQSKGTFIPVAGTAQGIKAMAQNSDSYKLWRAFGGGSSSQFSDPDSEAKVIERMAKRGGFNRLSIISPMRLIEALEKVGNFTESGSRIGEFQATYKPGDFDSALAAAFNSREVSTDFSMRGGNTSLQVWTRLVPFMNPAMQGLYKTGRVLSGADGKRLAAKAAILGTGMALASIMLALSNSDEDWYRRIEEWEKATYWHFKLGGQVWRIPKPFEYGMFFASIPEAIALLQQGKEGWEDFKKRMLQVLSQVSIRAVPQVAIMLAEPWANKSFFTGRKIVPDRQERLEPGLQANPNTSKVAQAAGEAANVSPAMIDNVVRNVFGTIGVHAETVADLLLEQTGTFPPGKERGWQSWPALKAFVRDPDNPNTKQQRDFYDALEKYRTAVNSVRELKARGQEDKAEAYSEQKADELSSAKLADKAAARLAKIRKAVRAIEWDRDMTPAEKREAINEKNAEMQDIVEEHTPLYQAAKKSYARPATEGGQQ